MAKTKTLVNLIKEMVRQEVKKEVREIFIREGVKAVTQNKNIVPEVLAKPSPKKTKPKEVSYTKDPTLNKILNETANTGEFDEYPTMGGGTFDTSKMTEAMGYGNVLGDSESRRKASAIQTAQSVGVDPNNPAVQDVMSNLTRDYRDVMKAVEKKKGR
ncbi:MAG: hypothetical protein CBD58_00950 [bacterium TMED198]|nr:MAG: hypothetical protein CBD58_00950 [bacterium TMED198]|tara:strand:- start:14845 stop:15318 length:474 start_codon:yes stop_codon:yes gene_type:complete